MRQYLYSIKHFELPIKKQFMLRENVWTMDIAQGTKILIEEVIQ
nr:MAG TPA: hypothetical protein [Caudoviricetes sp.]